MILNMILKLIYSLVKIKQLVQLQLYNIYLGSQVAS